MTKILFIAAQDKAFLSHRQNLIEFAKFKNLSTEIVCKVTNNIEDLKKLKSKFYDWEISRGSVNLIREIKSFYKLYKIIKLSNPDLIHSVSIKPSLYGGILNILFFKKPIVFAFGGLGFIFNSKKKLARIIRLIVKFLFKIIFRYSKGCLILQNNDDKLKLIKQKIVKEEFITIIPGSGVNTNKFKKRVDRKNRKEILVMFAGRILWDKGIKEFILLSKEIKKSFRYVRFVIVGEVDYHNPEHIKDHYIQNWKKEGFVEFWGFSSNMKETLLKADIFCFPSYREGFPKVLLEAASLEIPIVSFDVPGCREIVKNLVNGYLVKFKDQKNLESSVLRLIKSRTERTRMGKNGRNLVIKNFSDQVVTKMTYDKWKLLINNS